jgi:hypothetical protein
MKRALLATLAIAAIVIPGAAAVPPNGEDHKVTICHQTHSVTNPVVIITVDRASFDLNPNGQGHFPPHHESGDEVEDYGKCEPVDKKGGDGPNGNHNGWGE